MEQAAGYWLLTKREHNLNSTHFKSINSEESWEEQAFAEDVAGPQGGCIWPPRSYSCSFCRREFRSARALGGHMNVHRRDRARLKQFSSIQNNSNINHLQSNYPFSSNDQLCTFVYNPNPVVISSPSAPPSQKTFMIPSSSSPIVKEQQQHMRSRISSPKSLSNLVVDKNNSRILESACRVKTDLSVSLNLVDRRTRPAFSDDKEEATAGKRRRTEASSQPLFLKPCSIDERDHLQSEVHKVLNPSSIEDLDLELRLGDPPKVK